MYTIDWNKFLQWNLPSWMRQEGQVRWLSACTKPLQNLLAKFQSHETATRTDLKVTGQVRVLRHWLNGNFDPVLKDIYLEELPMVDTVFMYLESENQPLALPRFLSGRTVDFRVHLPNDLSNYQRIVAFVQKHKLPSKTFDISISIIRQ